MLLVQIQSSGPSWNVLMVGFAVRNCEVKVRSLVPAKILHGVAKRSTAVDLRSIIPRFESLHRDPVAQLVEQRSNKPCVEGSSPSTRTPNGMEGNLGWCQGLPRKQLERSAWSSILLPSSLSLSLSPSPAVSW